MKRKRPESVLINDKKVEVCLGITGLANWKNEEWN